MFERSCFLMSHFWFVAYGLVKPKNANHSPEAAKAVTSKRCGRDITLTCNKINTMLSHECPNLAHHVEGDVGLQMVEWPSCGCPRKQTRDVIHSNAQSAFGLSQATKLVSTLMQTQQNNTA